MKKILFTIVIAMTATIISCNSSEQKDTKDGLDKTEKKEDQPKANASSSKIPDDMKPILGEWKLDQHFRDDNGNHKIDEGEEKAVLGGTNYMKLNADGTCKYETVMDGKYEIVTEDEGRKKLIFYDMSGNKYPMSLYINSVNENELIINVVAAGSQFEIYKRP